MVDSVIEIRDDVPDVIKSGFKFLVNAKVHSGPDIISEFIEVDHLFSTFSNVNLFLSSFVGEIFYTLSNLGIQIKFSS